METKFYDKLRLYSELTLEKYCVPNFEKLIQLLNKQGLNLQNSKDSLSMTEKIILNLQGMQC